MHKMRRIRLGQLVFILLIVSISWGAWWVRDVPAPMVEALAAMASDEDVTFASTNGWLVFRPAADVAGPSTGLIFYPGGRVDPRSYAPFARSLAAAGHLAIIMPMPLNLAVLGADLAADVVGFFPETTTWTIGGHSLGGAMAARFATRNPALIDGLLLVAAYPATSDSLAGSALAVVSVYGTADGLATIEKIDASRALLPESTVWIPVEGGNHAQFGWYGEQAGDNPATISRTEQQSRLLDAALLLMAGI
jgi:hypothetical protein